VLHAQTSAKSSQLAHSLGIATGNDTKSNGTFNRMVDAIPATSAALATTASTTLPKFVAHRDYVAADVPINLAKGGLNGDGILDLVVPNFNSTNTSVLLGKNDDSFQTVRLFNSGGVQPFDAVVADFNGDGKNDVAETFPSAGLAILRGDGLGHLGTPALLAAGTHPLHIVSADFNGDHKADLAVTNSDSNNVSILLGKGDGTFTVAPSPAVGMAPVGIVLGDFNGDGKTDLAFRPGTMPARIRIRLRFCSVRALAVSRLQSSFLWQRLHCYWRSRISIRTPGRT